MKFWLIIGFMGQLLFTARILVQWISFEIRIESLSPTSFWYFSITGGAVLLIYSIYRADLLFIVGQLAGLIVYARYL